MKTVIIPDIHTEFDRAENIIRAEMPDKVIFLGDYFDTFDDELDLSISDRTAKWLVQSMDTPNRVHLMGNHDAHYAFEHPSFQCSGYEDDKNEVIHKVMTENHWRHMPLFTWCGSWLCSHAGVHHSHFDFNRFPDVSVDEYLTSVCSSALRQAFSYGSATSIMSAGKIRRGSYPYGGIIWCDIREFTPTPGLKQIFGHTALHNYPWMIDDEKNQTDDVTLATNICIDSTWNCRFYAVHLMDNNNKETMQIKSYDDL